MATNPALYEEDIVKYYEQCQIDYELVWHLNTQMCMHYGYWNKKTRTLRAALNQMNEELANQVQVSSEDEVLDAGCGVGGSSIYLAKNIGCRVKGITLTPGQVIKSGENALKHGVSDLVSFENRNYLHTGFSAESFDVVWAIESVCYALEKADFLREAFRLLRPGGRLVVADFYAEPVEPGSADFELLNKWTDSWAIKAYEETDVFLDKCAKMGFQNISCRNVTQNVLPSIKRLYYSFFPGAVVTTVSQALGFRNSVQTKNTWSTYYQYKAYKRGLWRYNIISSVKPV